VKVNRLPGKLALVFRIAAFAELGGVSSKILRDYDRLGLFRPAWVDRYTSYRLYTPAQLPDLRRILFDPSLRFDVCFNTRSNKRYLREAGHPYLEPPARDGVQPYYGFEGAVRMAHEWLKVANQRFFRKYAAYTGDAA